MNPYRPAVDWWLKEDTTTDFVLVPSAPVIGKDYVHFGIQQDVTKEMMRTLFFKSMVIGEMILYFINALKFTLWDLRFMPKILLIIIVKRP